MAITLTQDVAHKEMPVGTDWVFTINSTNVGGNYKFKYIADLYISAIPGGLPAYSIRLKFSPNSTGVGMISLSDILEQYVSSDNLGFAGSPYDCSFKGAAPNLLTAPPIHCIDKLSLNSNNIQNLTIKWGEEYSVNSTDAPTIYADELVSDDYLLWNGVAYNNEQELVGAEYGINITDWNNSNYIMNSITSKMLTDTQAGSNVSTGQLIGDNDYATLSFLSGKFSSGHSKPDAYTIQFFDSDNVFISGVTTSIIPANGGYDSTTDTGLVNSNFHLQYIGVGTANMLGAGITIPSNWDFYIIYLTDGVSVVSTPYQYHRKGADCKGFETIRLTWLNKFGVWDYYNFTKKNTRATDIKRTEFNSVKGNWNGSTFTKYGFERGRGVLNTSATETMSLNSDWFTNDEEAAWIEQLFISPEVYILGGYDATDTAPADYGKYMTPVMITNKSFDRYTRANDKVAQYEVDIEYSINKRIQRA